MKTIKLTKLRDCVSRSSSGPFSLKLANDINMAYGRIFHIRTGWGFDVPKGVELRVVSPDDENAPVVLSWYVEKGELVVVCCERYGPGRFCRGRQGQEYGIVQFVSVEEQDVRFIEFKGGKRVIVGETKPAQNAGSLGITE